MNKFLKVLSVLVIIGLVGFVSIYAVKLYFWDSIYEEREALSPELAKAIEDKKKELDKDSLLLDENFLNNRKKNGDAPFTVALLGVDSNDAKSGRTDTIIVAIVDPKNEKISMVSLPRDTRVEIIGKGNHDKINHAYAFGGVNMTLASLEHFLEIPIDYYMTIDFKGFQNLIDAMGGVEIDVEKDIRFPDRITGQNFTLSEGLQHLNGIQALNYSRFRSDGEGDFGRNRRQQQVVTAMIDQSTDLRNIPKMKEMFDILGENMRTDIDFDTMLGMVMNLKGINGSNVENVKLNAYPSSISGISYVIVDDADLQNVRKELQNKLNYSHQ